MSADPRPLRLYACYIDEILHTRHIPHPELEGTALEQDLHRRFLAWIEMIAPGAHEAGRVDSIEYTDMFD
jgi:hypothetical protein